MCSDIYIGPSTPLQLYLKFSSSSVSTLSPPTTLAVGLLQQSTPAALGRHSSSKAAVSVSMRSMDMRITMLAKQRIIRMAFKAQALRTLESLSASSVHQMHSLLSSAMRLPTVVPSSLTFSISSGMTINILTSPR